MAHLIFSIFVEAKLPSGRGLGAHWLFSPSLEASLRLAVSYYYVTSLYIIYLDEGQITHLICARLKYDLYDFFRGCFGPFLQVLFLVEKAQKHPLKKSYRSYFRRAQIR